MCMGKSWVCVEVGGVALFPGLCHLWLREERGGPGIFSHACDIKGRKVVERT